MVLDFASGFGTFAFILVSFSLLLDLLSRRWIRIDGLDLMFFAPWLTGVMFGVYEGLVMAVIVMIIHSLLHTRIAKYILFSSPALLLAVLSGHFIGMEGFWITLVGYYIVSTLITAITGGLGGRYFMFLLVNILTNIATLFVYRFLFL